MPVELRLVPVSPNDNIRGINVGVTTACRATAILPASSYRSLGETERFFPRTLRARSRGSSIPRTIPPTKSTQTRRQRMIDTMVEQAAAEILNQVERDDKLAVGTSNELLITGLDEPSPRPDRYENAAHAFMRDRKLSQPFLTPIPLK